MTRPRAPVRIDLAEGDVPCIWLSPKGGRVLIVVADSSGEPLTTAILKEDAVMELVAALLVLRRFPAT